LTRGKYEGIREWRDITAVASGALCIAGIKKDGTVVVAWKEGEKEDGKGDVSGWRDIVAVEIGYKDFCGLKSDGSFITTGAGSTRESLEKYRDTVDKEKIEQMERDVLVEERFDSCSDFVSITGANVGLKADGTMIFRTPSKLTDTVAEWRDIVAISKGQYHLIGLKADGTVVAAWEEGKNEDGQCDVSEWRDIVAVSTSFFHTVGLKADGSLIAVGKNDDGQCDVSLLPLVGPFDKEKELERKLALERKELERKQEKERRKQEELERKQEEQRKQQEQSRLWREQGLCPNCGGEMGGLFKKKCKSCGQ
jgi:hypothetical protein